VVDLWKVKGSGAPRKTLSWWNALLRWKSVTQVIRLSQNSAYISTQGLGIPEKTFLLTETFLDTPSHAVYNSRNDTQKNVHKKTHPPVIFIMHKTILRTRVII